jgi:hypothetical protein
MWVTITDVVPMTSPQRVSSTTPVPMLDVTESIVASATTAPSATPRWPAASAVTVPRGSPSGTNGGSFATSNPDIASSSSLYSVAPHTLLSTESMGNVVFCVAVTRPVRRAASASIGSTNACAESYTSATSLG